MDIWLSSAYLAPVQYYSKLLAGDRIIIEQNDNYVKQSYRNRCNIMAANGAMPLSIPVEHSSTDKILMKDIRIAQHGNWQHMHWNTIVSAYNSTPFFEYYQDDFYPFYHNKYSFLFDFNEGLRTLILDLLNIDDISIEYSNEYKTEFGSEELDLREIIHPKKNWKELDSSFLSIPYYQVFSSRSGFAANMSIIDLLFNMGNESLLVLSKTYNKE